MTCLGASGCLSGGPHRGRWLLARRRTSSPRRRPSRAGIRRLAALGVFAALVAVALGAAGVGRDQGSRRLAAVGTYNVSTVLAQHSVASVGASTMRNASTVERALDFILSLQPEGTYVLSSPGEDDVVHMDVAHSAIALAKTGYGDRAQAAMDWLFGKMTVPGDADELGTYWEGEQAHSVDYAGSWWDHFRTPGKARTELSRGRAEGVGIALIATYAVYLDDPDYLSRRLGDYSVADRVAFAVRYLTSPAVQRADGRFSHRPDYRVSFNEEGARIVLGLRLAAEMLADADRTREASQARAASDRGLAALLRGEGLSQGMAYDYYALGIWGLVPPQRARQELSALDAAGLVTPDGVRNWDWQSKHAQGIRDRVRWWAQAQTIAPSETFDWAIASLTAGEVDNALQVEQRWLTLQRSDGGFPGGYLPVLGVSFGTPTSYAAARFVMLERLLTEVLGSGGLVSGPH